ncbi:MAG: YkoF family thiamine/hydroxymethylpyrimidine-binding protein, partial [Candidatus Halalkalibacterium sp. M3_1C_030]
NYSEVIIMKCQLAYLPMSTENIAEQVDDVIDFIDGYDLEYNVGEMSTYVEGDKEEVFNLVNDIYTTQNDNGNQFRLHVELLSSNNYS